MFIFIFCLISLRACISTLRTRNWHVCAPIYSQIVLVYHLCMAMAFPMVLPYMCPRPQRVLKKRTLAGFRDLNTKYTILMQQNIPLYRIVHGCIAVYYIPRRGGGGYYVETKTATCTMRRLLRSQEEHQLQAVVPYCSHLLGHLTTTLGHPFSAPFCLI